MNWKSAIVTVTAWGILLGYLAKAHIEHVLDEKKFREDQRKAMDNLTGPYGPRKVTVREKVASAPRSLGGLPRPHYTRLGGDTWSPERPMSAWDEFEMIETLDRLASSRFYRPGDWE